MSDVEDLVCAVVGQAEGHKVHDVALSVLGESWDQLTDADRRQLAESGFLHRCYSAFQSQRDSEPGSWTAEKKRRQKEARERRKLQPTPDPNASANAERALNEIRDAVTLKRKLEQVLLADADGNMRALINFRRVDAQAWAHSSGVKREAWARRNEWFLLADKELENEQVATIGELSCLDVLAEMAFSIWAAA